MKISEIIFIRDRRLEIGFAWLSYEKHDVLESVRLGHKKRILSTREIWAEGTRCLMR